MPASHKTDKRYLERHGNKLRVVVPVPRTLQPVLGCTKLKKSLNTDSLEEANRLKWSIVAAFQDQIRQAEAAEDSVARALHFAEVRRSIVASGQDTDPIDSIILDNAEEIAGHPIGIGTDGLPIYVPEKEEEARRFSDIANGIRTPLDASRAAYLKQLNVNAKTLADDERAFKRLLDWCKREKIPALRETFDKRTAVRYHDYLRDNSGGLTARTLNKYITRLSQYWKFMERRGEVAANVWQGLTYTIPRETEEDRERAFTADEMVKLLSGPTTQHMHDLMRIAALTGARINVIVSLKAKDCRDGTIWFKPAKKETSGRNVPIHPDLREILERRTRGKCPDDDLFPEWPPVRKAGSKRERSYKASEHFTDYRRSVGVVDRRDGNRRERVNFHSFRRWFITQARHADQPLEVIQSVVGHKNQTITFHTYGREETQRRMRRCVEAVRLPKVDRLVVAGVSKKRRIAR